MSNFSMGTISGMGFAQAQVHTVDSTSACAKPIVENYYSSESVEQFVM